MKHVRIAAVVLAVCLLVVCQSVALAQNLGAAPQMNVAVQGQTGAQPEGAFLNFVNWVGNVIAPVGAGVAVVGGIVSYASGRGYIRWIGTALGLLAVSGLTRLLEFWIAQGRAAFPRMQSRRRGGWRRGSSIRPASFGSSTMQMINDGIGLLLGLAPVAALVALVLAGLALRNHGSALQNGRFGLWMFWAAVMLTLPQILSWFSGFGVPVPVSAGGGTALFNIFKVDITNFVNQFVVGYFAPVLAAWMVLRGVVEISEGRSPLYSILGAMFLLSIAATQALMQGWNSGTKFATADVLAGLWTYTASRILPVAAGLAIIGAILNFAFGKPAMRLVCCAAGFLTVSALWRLVVSMM